MRYEMVEVIVGSGIRAAVPYLECWRCAEDVLEWDMSERGLCGRCEDLCGDLALEDEEW